MGTDTTLCSLSELPEAIALVSARKMDNTFYIRKTNQNKSRGADKYYMIHIVTHN